MDAEQVRRTLQEKEQDLITHIGHLQEAARTSREAEVEDPIDAVISSEGKAGALQEGSLEYEVLTQVRDALRRLDDGTYGTCIDCGRTIEPARLEAVPWTPYCRDDQARRESR